MDSERSTSARLFRRYAAGQAGHARVNSADDKVDYRPLVGGVGRRQTDLVGWSQGEHLDQRYHPKAPVEDQVILGDVGIASAYEFLYLARNGGDLQILVHRAVTGRNQLSYDLQPLDAADRFPFEQVQVWLGESLDKLPGRGPGLPGEQAVSPFGNLRAHRLSLAFEYGLQQPVL